MPIILNKKEISGIRLGDKEVQSVKLGTVEVWENTKAHYLGRGKTFTVPADLRNKYGITIDDIFFYLEPPELNRLFSASYSCAQWSASGDCAVCSNFRDTVTMKKTYNASTGALTINYANRDVDVYVIPKSNELLSKGKITNLGSGTTWTIQNGSKYTVRNFLFRALPQKDSHYVCCSGGCPNWIEWKNTYNSSTGVLQAELDALRLSDTNNNTNPYLIPFVR